MTPAKKTIRLRDWATRYRIPYRTAINWANSGKITARKETQPVRVEILKTVTGYFIAADARPPRTVK